MPPQPHSVTSFALLCPDVVWSLLYNDIISDERSASLSTLPTSWMKILNQVPAPTSYPLPFFHSVRNTHSPIKLREVKVIGAKLFINIDTAAESGASHWGGTSPLKHTNLYTLPQLGGIPVPFSTDWLLRNLHSFWSATALKPTHPSLSPFSPLRQTSVYSPLLLPATLPPKASLMLVIAYVTLSIQSYGWNKTLLYLSQ